MWQPGATAGCKRAGTGACRSRLPPAPPEPVAATHAALVDSVRHHFVSDVPVGILLSGGIDSTSLVALARQAGVGDLRTFTLSIPGFAADEGDRARRTAEHFGTRHEEYRVGAMAGRDLFTGFLQAMDQPSIDGLNTFAVAGFTSGHGMKVMLSGLGADEMFGGYPSFANVPRLARWNRTLGQGGAGAEHRRERARRQRRSTASPGG